MQNIVSPSLALLLMLYIFYPQYILLSHHYAFPSNLGVITLPLGMIRPQACLASTNGLPSPWTPEEKLSLCKWSRRWQYLTSFILDCEASSAGNDSAFVRCPVASIVTNCHRDWHHPTLEVLGFLRSDSGKPIKTNLGWSLFTCQPWENQSSSHSTNSSHPIHKFRSSSTRDSTTPRQDWSWLFGSQKVNKVK